MYVCLSTGLKVKEEAEDAGRPTLSVAIAGCLLAETSTSSLRLHSPQQRHSLLPEAPEKPHVDRQAGRRTQTHTHTTHTDTHTHKYLQ